MKNNINIDITKYTGISTDSRDIKPGYIYAAIKGSHFNGEDFIDDSITKGATMILVNQDSTYDKPCSINMLKVPNIRVAVSSIASQLYPKQPENIVAITGTNGKTSNAYFYKQFAELLGHKSACIGTLGLISNYATFHQDHEILTSPDSITMHKMLHSLESDGISHVAIEASSHGLDQHRIDSVDIKAAAFTNFTQDHLDYHHDMESYFQAKMRLFTDVMQNGIAILNADIPEFERMVKLIGESNKVVSYGKNGIEYKLISFADQQIEFEVYGKRFSSQISLNGYFQAQNLLCSIALCVATGMNIDDLVSVIPQIQAAPGRLEQVAEVRGAKIFIDYAHTPDALEKALSNLKTECKGRLLVVFGCGGDRDRAKRPIMGKIASDIADVVIVSDDNPRFEDPAAIRKEILAGALSAHEMDSRKEAISHAIDLLQEDDILLVAGKGHETYQIIGDTKVYFSDHEEIMRFAIR